MSWQEKITKYFAGHPGQLKYDPRKGSAAPELRCESLSQASAEGGKVAASWQVKNNGNAVSFFAHVRFYEAPYRYSSWEQLKLRFSRVLTLNPGQAILLSFDYTPEVPHGYGVAACFDPLLDPRGPLSHTNPHVQIT